MIDNPKNLFAGPFKKLDLIHSLLNFFMRLFERFICLFEVHFLHFFFMNSVQLQYHSLLEVFQVTNENKHKKGKSENDKIEVEIFDDGLFHVQMVQFFS